MIGRNDPIIHRVRTGKTDNPFIDINESLYINANGVVDLTELPDSMLRVTVTGDNKDWFEIENGIPSENQYKVDYKNKLVTFHISNAGKQLNFQYKGRGITLVPDSMIYTERDENGGVKETLRDLTDSTKLARDNANQTNIDVQNAEASRETAEDIREQQEDERQANTTAAIGRVDSVVNETRFKDVYSPTVAYKKNNVVYNNGSAYMAKQDTKGNAPTDDPANLYWALISRKGADGNGTVHRHKDTFTATEGQTIFTLSHTYDQFQNRTSVTVGGVPQRTPENYEEASSNTIILNSGIPAGTIVEVIYYSEAVPLQIDLQTTVDNHTAEINKFNDQSIYIEDFVATEGQSVFTLQTTYDQLQDRIEVYVEGLLQDSGDNYTESGNNQITLSEGLPAGTEVKVRYYGRRLPIVSDVEATLNTHSSTLSNHSSELSNVNVQLADKAKQIDLKDRGLSVKWYGAEGTTSDNTPAFQVVMDELDTGSESVTGGRIILPRGTYKGSLVIKTTHASNLASITIEGQGQQNTIIDGTGLASNTNGIEVRGGIFVKIKDLQVKNTKGHGIAILGQQSGYSVWNHLQMENVRSSVSGKSGIYLERGFMASFQDVFSTNNANYGFELKGFHTSLNFTNCYGVSNAYDNFYIHDSVYTSFVNCGSDKAGQFGYRIRNCNTVGFINCGAETCQRSGYHIEASAAIEGMSYINKGTNQVSFEGCFAFDCDKAGAGYGNFLNVKQLDTSKIKGIKVENCYDLSPNGTYSLIINGANVDVIEDNNKFAGVIAYQAGAERKINKYPYKTSGISVTTANTPVCSLKHDYEHLQNYGGLLTVTARYADFTTGNANSATYILMVGKHAANGGVTLLGSSGLTDGAGASYPSFTFSLDSTNNKLLVSPVGSTSGTFYFSIETQGSIIAY